MLISAIDKIFPSKIPQALDFFHTRFLTETSSLPLKIKVCCFNLCSIGPSL